jgi:hypothetical protein
MANSKNVNLAENRASDNSRVVPSFVVLAVGAKSIVALHREVAVTVKDAIIELEQLKYHGSVEKLRTAPFYTKDLPDGSVLLIFGTDGQHELSYTSKQPQPAVQSSMTLSVGSRALPPYSGIVWLFAPKGWGKTTTIETIARANTLTPQNIVRFAEPNAASEYYGEGLDTHGVNYVTAQIPFLMLIDMASRLYDDPSAISYYDSFRYYVHAAGLGGTGERGVDNLLPTQCTSLGNVFTTHRRLAFVSINPKISLETDEEHARFGRLVDDYAGAVDMLIAGTRTQGRAIVFSRSHNLREGIHGAISTGDRSANLVGSAERKSHDIDNTLTVFIDGDPELTPETFESLLKLNTLARTPMTWDNTGKKSY